MQLPDSTLSVAHVPDQRALKQLIQQMNRALRDSQGGGLMERFEAISKLLFTKIVDEREVAGRWNGSPAKANEELRRNPGEPERLVYERARSVWQRAVTAYPHVFAGSRGQFPTDVAGVARIVGILEPVSLSATSNDVKGGAYEAILHNTFEKNENQQYFTPRHIVEFMVQLCDPKPHEAVCDPASGSGGFLVGVLNHLDHTADDLATVATQMRGAEIDARMAWIARINVLMHGGDPRTVYHVGGAGALSPLIQLRRSLPHQSFDLILTNPPFGSDLIDREALDKFKTGQDRQSRRRGILFIERCLELLKPGGRLAVILDDSALNLPSNSDIRELVRQQGVVEAVISLPDVTFMPYSTAKSSILVVRRRHRPTERQGPVLMADVENVGNRPNGDPLYGDEYDEDGQRRLKSDLPQILQYYRRFQVGKSVQATFGGTTVFTADIDKYCDQADASRLDVYFYHPARQEAQAILDRSCYTLANVGELVELDNTSVNPTEEFADNGVRWIGLGDIEALTGRFEVKNVPGDRIRSSAHVFRGGDLLFSRLRPKLRKVALIPPGDEGGICSSELLVLRLRNDGTYRLLPEFLAYMLRTDLVYGQLIFQITGVGRPRVSSGAVRRLVLPIPPLDVQRKLVLDLSEADRVANRFRTDAAELLDLANHEIDRAFERMMIAMFDELQPSSSSSDVGVETSEEPLRAFV